MTGGAGKVLWEHVWVGKHMPLDGGSWSEGWRVSAKAQRMFR